MQTVKELLVAVVWQQGGSSASDKDSPQYTRSISFDLQFPAESCDISPRSLLIKGQREEVAVDAFSDTVWYMDIEKFRHGIL
jgi:hypothetical protein